MAVSLAPWITVNPSYSGLGSDTVSYTVAANPSGSARIGTLTVAGQTFTVTQDGGILLPALLVGPSALNSRSQEGAATTDAQNIYVFSSQNEFNFTATAVSGASWLVLSSAGGITPANVRVTINASGLQAGT
jgi:hypothetical protein